jgi:hypothetical protein
VGADIQLHADGIAEEQRPLRPAALDLTDLGPRLAVTVAMWLIPLVTAIPG